MNQRSLFVALVVLVVLGGLAYLNRKPTTAPPAGAFGAGSPVLAIDLNKVRVIELKRSTNEVVRIEHGDGGWQIASMHGYPASFDKIADHLRGLGRTKAVALMRGGEAYPEEFGLTPESGDYLSLRLLGEGQGEPVLATLEAGSERGAGAEGNMQPGGRFVRVDQGPVLLADEFPFAIPRDGLGWTDTSLPRLSTGEVTEINVERTGGERYSLRRTPGGQFVLADLAEGEEMQPGQGQHVARALEYLSFVGVADPQLSEAELGLEQPDTYQARSSDGIVLTYRLGATPEPNHRYARVEIELAEPPAPAEPALGEDLEEAAREAAQTQHQSRVEAHKAHVASARQKVEEWNRRCKGWTFLLQTYNAEQMLTARSKLAVTKKEPAPEQPDSTEQAPEEET